MAGKNTATPPVEPGTYSRPDKTPVEFVASPSYVGYLDGFQGGYDDAAYNFTKWLLIWTIVLVSIKLISISTKHE